MWPELSQYRRKKWILVLKNFWKALTSNAQKSKFSGAKKSHVPFPDFSNKYPETTRHLGTRRYPTYLNFGSPTFFSGARDLSRKRLLIWHFSDKKNFNLPP